VSGAFRTPEDRALCALALALDPSMRPQLRLMLRMAAPGSVRADYMHVRRPDGRYDRTPDPGAWNAHVALPGGGRMPFCLLRFRDGQWSIHS
jgi:hypothetical protein